MCHLESVIASNILQDEWPLNHLSRFYEKISFNLTRFEIFSSHFEAHTKGYLQVKR